MARSTTYYTLIGSLPALPRHFEEAERVPISRRNLIDRLTMLQPHDADVVEEMTDFLAWERQPLERTNEDVARRFDQFMAKVDDQFAQHLIRRSVNVRTIIAALRCRRLKLEPPVSVEPIASRIARGWSQQDLGLGNQYPWIAEVDAQLKSDAPLDLERTILNIAWQYRVRLADEYQFTFEAVILYLTRWEIVYRWTHRDAKAGREKFEHLVSESMGEYADMFADQE